MNRSLIINVSLIFVIIVSLIFGTKQYQEKQSYMRYISSDLSGEFMHLIQDSIEAYTMNNKILEDDKITSEQLRLLSYWSSSIQQKYQSNMSSAMGLNLYEKKLFPLNDDLYNIHRFYNELKEKSINKEGSKLDSDTKRKIEFINEFYKFMLTHLSENIDEVNENETNEGRIVYHFDWDEFRNKYSKTLLFESFWIDSLADLSDMHVHSLVENELWGTSLE